ncbi:MAG: putative 2OG-Fe(II) oxygenase [Novosphingobium sp.]
MNPAEVLARGPSSGPAQFLQAASTAIEQGKAHLAEPALAEATKTAPGEPRFWQFLGLARRALQDSAGANLAFAKAAALAPQDPLIAHSLARTALEAGFPALEPFNRARLLAPADGSVVLGRVAALLALGKGTDARDQLRVLLSENPGWIEGHQAYAKLTAQIEPDQPIDDTLRAALLDHPQAGALWQTQFEMLMQAQNYRATIEALDRCRRAIGDAEELDRIEALCLSELGEATAAQAIFDRLPFPASADAATWPLRNFIRLGRYEEALLLAEQSFGPAGEAVLWPYRALLWRLAGDPRWDWLEGDPRLIGTYDIAPALGSLTQLADLLRSLHSAHGAPLDQSVRGGTQTDGNLLARAEPELRELRAVLLEAVQDYVDQLPPPVAGHPFLVANRKPLQVAGAWSVRLTDRGFHVDHVHQQGWISSACYIAVPESDPQLPEGGWLAFGECRDLLPGHRGFRLEQPSPGKLVLFPSIMWHGTRPFGSGERMTVAFDIAPPPAQ